MTDISISDINRISYEDLDKKISQLSHYITRVGQRLKAINNFSKTTSHQQRSDARYPKTASEKNIRVNR